MDAPAADFSDFLSDELAAAGPAGNSNAPAKQGDDEYEVEAPDNLPLGSSQTPDGKDANPYQSPGADLDDHSRDTSSSWALKFVGVYGLVIMGAAILEALGNIIVGIFIALRPEVSLGMSVFVFGGVAFQVLIAFVIFRLGRGLLDSERSAVQGLLVIYLLIVGLGTFGYFWVEDGSFPLVGLAILVGISSLIFLPPVLVAFLNWRDFRASED